MVDFVGVLALLPFLVPFLLVWLISEDLDPLSTSSIVLTGLSYRKQLADLVLEDREMEARSFTYNKERNV